MNSLLLILATAATLNNKRNLVSCREANVESEPPSQCLPTQCLLAQCLPSFLTDCVLTVCLESSTMRVPNCEEHRQLSQPFRCGSPKRSTRSIYSLDKLRKAATCQLKLPIDRLPIIGIIGQSELRGTLFKFLACLAMASVVKGIKQKVLLIPLI